MLFVPVCVGDICVGVLLARMQSESKLVGQQEVEAMLWVQNGPLLRR